jgi:heme/copper-type cytochrome/quinol oxidase subunit 3
MEIPYIVNPRKDTGLTNSKIAIWLFLASEVMLFGGFFSAYIFLRLGADYPWPERTLPVLPGLINTFVLIGSSVTVVFAWVALKLRKWIQFQIYMGITVFCALIFMALKAVEYNVKFHHQAVRLNDFSVVEGHLGYEKEGKEYSLDHHGKKIEQNVIRIKVPADNKITFSTLRFHADWVEEFIAVAEHKKSSIKLPDDIKAVVKQGAEAEVIAKKGEALSVDLLKKIQKAHLKARNHNAALRTKNLKENWEKGYEKHPDKKSRDLKSEINIDTEVLAPFLLTEIPTIAFEVDEETEFLFKPRDIQQAPTQSKLRDDTVIEGDLQDSPLVFHNVDAIDFQHLVMVAEKKGIEPEVAIKNSWLMQNHKFVREIWAWHEGEIEKLRKVLNDRHGFDKDGKPKREPTHKELYRIGWKEMAKYGEEKHKISLSGSDKFKEEFMGPNYEARGDKSFPHLSVPRDEIRFEAKFTPAWNTYYAIYFTITGLHGLHVIGGAFVLAYYLFFGRKMFLENPEWLANRVEVAGLFWHFVDLVWIFVFPILYLM